jgi:ectoine hydroxylase-related dioxygenase (phytanoyl-CoA dioxygenase family)
MFDFLALVRSNACDAAFCHLLAQHEKETQPMSAAHAAHAAAPNLTLSQEQIAFFRREGYLSIDKLTTDEDVAKLRVSYDRIFAQQAGRDEGNQFDLAGTDEEGKKAQLPQILNPAKYAPEMNDSLLLANANAVAKQLFGPDAKVGFGHAILKPAGSPAPTPWHQDAAYWSPDFDHDRQISIWVPLQDTPVEMGCMQFVPRSHEGLNIVRHQHINNDPRIHGLELHESEMHRVKDVAVCPLQAGGCTIHGGYALHYTSPNQSDTPRRALIIMGGLPPTKRATPRDLPWQHEEVSSFTLKKAAKP